MEVGASRHTNLPNGYNIDRHRIKLGAGKSTFAVAKIALQRWDNFDKAWIRLFPESVELRPGSTIAIVPKHWGFYSINLCRIVYVVDSEGPITTFGFAYGTLPEHSEIGEERFTVAWDRSDASVWYEIIAFSTPRAVLARIGYPIGRYMQRRFGRASLAAMMKAGRGFAR